MSFIMVLVLFIVLAAVFGGFGTRQQGWGYAGWSPLGLFLLYTLVLLITGHLHG